MSKITVIDQSSSNELDRSEAALLEHLSDRYRKNGHHGLLRFPQPLEENYQRYREAFAAKRLRHVSALFAVSLLLLAGVNAWGYAFSGESLWAVCLPIATALGAIALVSWLRSFWAFASPAALLVSSLWSLALVSAAPGIAMDVNHAFISFAGMSLLFFFAFCQPLLTWTIVSIVASAAIWVGMSAWQGGSEPLAAAEWWTLSASIAAMAVFTLVTVYVQEREHRDIYLREQQNQITRIDPKELDENRGRLRFLVSLDSLTGIANRKSLDRALKMEWERAARKKQNLSMVMVDINKMDAFNKRYGNQCGDDWMQKVAKELKRFARRPGDIAARFADDCFVLLLADTEATNAGVVAQNILQNIQTSAAELEQESGAVAATVCIGVATLIPDPKRFPADLIGDATLALKQAKRLGQNQVYNLAAG